MPATAQTAVQGRDPRLPVTDLDPYSVENILDPYPLHEALRELGPIVWLNRYGTLAVSRYRDVSAVLLNPKDFISSAGVGMSDVRKPGSWRPAGPLVESDPPLHTQIRHAMNKIVTPSAVRVWRERFLAVADQLLDAALKAGTVEAVDALVERYIFTVFTDALGVELDRTNAIIIGNHSFNAAGPKNELFQKTLAKAEAISEWFEGKQQQDATKEGGFGAAVFAAEASGAIPQGTASPILRTLIRGGMDTTISGLGTVMRLLALDPAIWESLKSDGSLGAGIFEEAIRLESPVQSIYRTTAHACTFEGLELPGDTKVQVLLGAANRDPRQWDEPDAFKPGRRTGVHSAFGTGAHMCLGKIFSRFEVECFLEVLRARVTRSELAGVPRARAVNGLRTLDVLPLRLG